MVVYALLKIVLLLQVMRVEAGEYCTYDYSSVYDYETRYCDYGCCGTKYSSYSSICCSKSYNSYSSDSSDVSVGAIVGSVIGSLAGLAILIAVIKCCCAFLNNPNRRSGIVLQPANTNMHTLVVNTTALSQGQSNIPVQQGAVGYGNPIAGPPPPYFQDKNVSQGSTNPAYQPSAEE